MTAHLEVEAISKIYGAVTALDRVSLAVEQGAYVVLLGPSGSGKTTLLSVIGGFTVPTSGRVSIAGRDVTALSPAQRPTTTLFQDYALFPHMSVAGNVGFGLKVRRVAQAEREKRIAAALELVGLAGYGGRGIHEISGGRFKLGIGVSHGPTLDRLRQRGPRTAGGMSLSPAARPAGPLRRTTHGSPAFPGQRPQAARSPPVRVRPARAVLAGGGAGAGAGERARAGAPCGRMRPNP